MDLRKMLARVALSVSTGALAVVMLSGFKTPVQLAASSPSSARIASGSAAGTAALSGSSGAPGTGVASAGGSGVGAATGAGAKPAPTASTGTKVVLGPIEDAYYGGVQVQLTITNGRIVDIKALQLPSGGRSGAISRYVSPILRSESLSANSANIQIISGATYTSSAYAASLQAALDQVHA